MYRYHIYYMYANFARGIVLIMSAGYRNPTVHLFDLNIVLAVRTIHDS